MSILVNDIGNGNKHDVIAKSEIDSRKATCLYKSHVNNRLFESDVILNGTDAIHEQSSLSTQLVIYIQNMQVVAHKL